MQLIPCNQANGFPPGFENDWGYGDQGNGDCEGQFVSHFWCESKHRIPARTKMSQLLFQSIAAGELQQILMHTQVADSGNRE